MRATLDLHLIEEIMVIYLVNLPPEELEEERLIFHLKAGYFHYLNKHRLKDHSSSRLKKEEELRFMQKINEYLPIDYRQFPYQIEQFYQLTASIPCFGAIISHQTKQGRFYLFIRDRRTGKYGFPKGKRIQGETEIQCAQRETKEQTKLKVRCQPEYVQPILSRKKYRFYHGLLENGQNFERRTICEGRFYCYQISEIVWFSKEEIKSKDWNVPTLLSLKIMKLLG